MQDNEQGPRLLVVWHSRTGASEQMAKEAAAGAAQEVVVDCLMASCVTTRDVLLASVYLFVCPENLGALSGGMKEFFDTQYYSVLGRLEGRPYATIIAAGSDGTGAQRQLDRIVTGWRLKRVVDPMIVNFAAQTPDAILAQKMPSASVLSECRELGTALGAGASLGVF